MNLGKIRELKNPLNIVRILWNMFGYLSIGYVYHLVQHFISKKMHVCICIYTITDSYVPNCYAATLYTFYRLPGVIIIFIYSSLILHHLHCCSLLCHLLKKMHFYSFRIILSYIACQIANIVKIYQKDRNARQCSRLL